MGTYQTPLESRLERVEERSLTPSPSAPNLLRPEAFRVMVNRAAPLAGPRRNSAALIIPDYAARMTVLEFEEFPPNEEERISLLRFRLRKSVPFHVEDARLSYAIQHQEPKRIEVLVVAISRAILVEYESLLTQAGYRVGLVLPSSLAALPLFTEGGDTLNLVMKAAGTTLSVLLIQGNRVRLARCLDLAAGEESSDYSDESVIDLLQQTVAFAEDQINAKVGRILLCGFGNRTTAIGTLAQTEFAVPYDSVQSKFGMPGQENAGLFGLLERYAA